MNFHVYEETHEPIAQRVLLRNDWLHRGALRSKVGETESPELCVRQTAAHFQHNLSSISALAQLAKKSIPYLERAN